MTDQRRGATAALTAAMVCAVPPASASSGTRPRQMPLRETSRQSMCGRCEWARDASPARRHAVRCMALRLRQVRTMNTTPSEPRRSGGPNAPRRTKEPRRRHSHESDTHNHKRGADEGYTDEGRSDFTGYRRDRRTHSWPRPGRSRCARADRRCRPSARRPSPRARGTMT